MFVHDNNVSVSCTVPLLTGLIAQGCVFTDRIRKTSQRHFSTIHFGGLGLRAMVISVGYS